MTTKTHISSGITGFPPGIFLFTSILTLIDNGPILVYFIPKTNSKTLAKAPESHGCLEDVSSFFLFGADRRPTFRGKLAVSFRVGIISCN